MNAKKLAAAVIMFATAGTTFAQSAEFVAPDANFVSSKTRLEVTAELRRAQSDGALSFSEETYPLAVDRTGMPAGTRIHTGMMKPTGVHRFDPTLYFGA